ncbi:hypothetical protein DDW05_02340 [Candidatus Nanobsidianus stetteri]|uniref:Uncharacterized protein n=1 Tax=Nanobsidianus stetteri TaxID=1294122 RepID=A0A2T9WSE2_NANST|nr:hypothetical protein DDW05_02340 [Candidatus Nanobsidianus stetteri]
MRNYMSCLYEKSYDDYFQCIRNCVNSKNSFKGASYIIKTKSGTEAISKNLIFYKIYGHAILGHHNLLDLPENSYLIVLLEKEDDVIEYIKEIGKKRQDIYVFDYYLRTKIPESILLRNSKNPEDIKKLIEARVYGFKTKRDIEKLKKSLDKKLVDIFYAPLSLSLILLLKNPEYFPNIYYISKPYTISTPYVFEISLGSSDIIKEPVKLFNDDLNFLSIIEFEKYPTIEPYSLGLNYDFELDYENLNKFEIQIKFDEFRHRFYDSIVKTSKAISTLKFSPADIELYQIVMKNGKAIFIDIASGNIGSLSQKGLEKITVIAIKDIIEGIKESPLLKHCTKKENYVICNEKIKDSELSKILVSDIERYLFYNNRTDNLIKNIKIGDHRLDDIIIQYKDDEFEENREIVSRAIELYLRSHVN